MRILRRPASVRRGARLAAFVAMAGLLTSTSLAGQPTPDGPEFQVNTYTTGDQQTPSVAADGAGNFVVVWTSLGSDGPDNDSLSIQGQRFAADGTPAGAPFEVNGSYSTGPQHEPRVARTPTGIFVVVWSTAPYQLGESIEARRFGGDGTPAGDAFSVDASTSTYLVRPDVAVDSTGAFVIVWEERLSPNADSFIRGRRYRADGTPIAAPFSVGSLPGGHDGSPAIEIAPDGGFVIAWEGWGPEPADFSLDIQAQRFGPDGSSRGPQFTVNTYTTYPQFAPSLAISGDGRFIVAWHGLGSTGTDTDHLSIHARRFAANGAPDGGAFQVNTHTTGPQISVDVAAEADGDFVVSWSSYTSSGSDDDGLSVQGRRFWEDGRADGDDLQFNLVTGSAQRFSRLATSPSGDFVAVWESFRSDGSDFGSLSVQARRFRALFRDGFESGDTSGWSSSQP